MRRTALLVTASLMLLALPAATAADDGGRPFVVPMTGAQEAPGPGDPDGTGTAWFTLNQGQEEICFALAVSDITLPATGAHIHIAPAGSPGPVVVPLIPPDASGMSSGCVHVDPALIKAIRQAPWNYYVNVHNADFPAGAVRGQLAR